MPAADSTSHSPANSWVIREKQFARGRSGSSGSGELERRDRDEAAGIGRQRPESGRSGTACLHGPAVARAVRTADRDADCRESALRADRYLPLLVWWAVEKHATVDRSFTVDTFASRSAWQTPLVREVILGRLIKRFAAEGSSAGYAAAARIFGRHRPNLKRSGS